MGRRRSPSAPRRPGGAGGSPPGLLLRSAWWLTALVAVAGLIGVSVRLAADDDDTQVTASDATEEDAEAFGGSTSAAPVDGAPAPASTTADNSQPTVAPDAASSGAASPDAGTAPPATPEPTTGAPEAAPSTSPDTAAPPTTTAEQAVPGEARCEDGAADSTTESLGDLDLLQTSLRRDTGGLHIAFQLAGPAAAGPANREPSVGDPGGEALTSWGVFMASDGQVLYGLVVERRGNLWTTTLISFLTEAQDRTYPQTVPGGADIQVTVPGADLPSLPAAFDWWAWTDSTRRPPTAGAYLGDDCPDGASETAGGSPTLAHFPG